jgi:uncharacterized protein involved in cysteine biosynthesis
LVVAWDFFDYPLGHAGMGVRDRFDFMKKNFGGVFGLGFLAAFVLLVPCIGLFVLPVGVVAATDLHGRTTASGNLRDPSGRLAP